MNSIKQEKKLKHMRYEHKLRFMISELPGMARKCALCKFCRMFLSVICRRKISEYSKFSELSEFFFVSANLKGKGDIWIIRIVMVLFWRFG